MADGNWPARRLPKIDAEVGPSVLTFKLEEYWRSVLNGRTMPTRADIDPAGMRRLLSNVFLLDVVDRPLRFRWRLAGTKIGDIEHAEYTGKWLDETVTHAQDPFIDFCRLTLTERRPTSHMALRFDPDGGSRPLVRTLLPLSEDGVTITMMLGAIDYAPVEIVPLQRGAA